MPNRILREGILTSPTVNLLSPKSELFYRRLMSRVDDFGRYEAHPAVLRAACYPMQPDAMSEQDIEAAVNECAAVGLLTVYEHNNCPFLVLWKLGTPRAKESKYPPPPNDAEVCAQTRARESIRSRMRPYSYSYSYSDASTDAQVAAQPAPPPPSTAAAGCSGGNGKAKPADTTLPGFVAFWQAWPPHHRKADRAKCLASWKSRKLEACAAEILAGLERWKLSAEWGRDGGQYIPAPLVWLNQGRWEAPLGDAGQSLYHAPPPPPPQLSPDEIAQRERISKLMREAK